MEAISVWDIYPSADRAELDTLTECVARNLGMDKPDTSGTEIAFTAETQQVASALGDCDPEWRDKALLVPTGRG